MRVSLNWINQYIDVTISPEDLAHRLTMVGLEVESIERLGEKFNNFVVGLVESVTRHPNADKLSICKVNVKRETLQIVCGAPNVAVGQKVAVGLAGAIVPKNQHGPEGKPFTLSHVKVRGEDSYGMICSAYELDIGEDKDGIMVLSHKAMTGTPLASYFGLNDTIFEIGVTPNRPDALSHIGVSREIAAILSKTVKTTKIKIKEGKKTTQSAIKIKISDKANCPRYTARVITGVKVQDSPQWLQDVLNAVNIRPINNIVDITNYVLLEIGQPLHAFDYNKISGHTIIVKPANDNDSFTTLDGKARKLRSDSLMICDERCPIAIAGVMGGLNSEISESTTDIILESAYFNPISIRRASKHLGLSTEASQRFERGADPNITVWAVNRAVQLISEIAGGIILKGVVDIYPKEIKEKKISLRVNKVNEILGTTLDKSTIIKLLQKIYIAVSKQPPQKQNQNILQFVIPTFRPDIEREIDLIEEVARIYGYNNIETKTRISLNIGNALKLIDSNSSIRNWLVGSGYNEVITNSMAEHSVAQYVTEKVVTIANPISKEMGALRTSMIPGILGIIRDNVNRGNKNLRFFEFGKVYFRIENLLNGDLLKSFTEKELLLLAFTGLTGPGSWDSTPRNFDIFDVKGELETLLQKIFLDKIKFIPYPNSNALTEMGLTVEIHGETAGSICVIRKEMLQTYEIEQDVICVELDMETINRHITTQQKYSVLPKFPSVNRDIAIIVDKTILVQDIEDSIRLNAGPILSSLKLFDIYTGNQIPADKKSCAFALDFLSLDHTLTQSEIDIMMQSIINGVIKQFKAIIRK